MLDITRINLDSQLQQFLRGTLECCDLNPAR